MANDVYLLLFAIIIFLFVLIIAIYLIFGGQKENRNRLQLVRAYKAAPRKIGDSPVLVHGPAGSSGVVMPAGGDPVAFHATFIMSRGCTLIRDIYHQNAIPANSSFKVFTTSGNFPVTDAGIPYTVSIISALERMNEGAGMFTEKNRLNAVLDGMPETVFDDMIQFEAGIQALEPIFAVTVSGRSVTSTIDSRIRTFTQGRDVPPGIAEILKGKIIRPQPGEEITVVEFYIPLKKSVWVFGEFDGTDTVRFGESGARLFVSYNDPDTEGM
ncbi:MAG: hypothetical protein LUQ35_04985 [Methanoregula sp.]|jgi:hypothetical protein|nr:hypothetical protein [Methanoregula sp.]